EPQERATRLKRAAALLNGKSADAVPPPPPPPRPTPAPPVGITLETPIQSLKGIGPVRGRLYTRLGIRTVRDLLFHFPIRHQPFPPATPIADLFFQAEGSVVGVLERLDVESLPKGLKKLRATVRDRTGTIQAVWLRHGVTRLGV